MSFCFIDRNYVSIWNWIQKYKPMKLSSKRKKIGEFVIDETLIKVGSEYIDYGLLLILKAKEYI